MQAMRTQRFSRNRAAAGFTMIELLIAIVILLVGVVAVAQLVPNAIRSDFRNRYDSTALILAQQQMEQMVEQNLTVGGPPAAGTYNSQIFLPDGTTALCNLGVAPPFCGPFFHRRAWRASAGPGRQWSPAGGWHFAHRLGGWRRWPATGINTAPPMATPTRPGGISRFSTATSMVGSARWANASSFPPRALRPKAASTLVPLR